MSASRLNSASTGLAKAVLYAVFPVLGDHHWSWYDQSMTLRIRWLSAALAWMLVIFWFSSQPQLPGFEDDLLDLIFKKAGHIIAYSILWTLLWLATNRPWLALFMAFLYAMADEYHQTFVPGRNGWWIDVGVDLVSALGALWFCTSRWGHQCSRRLGIGSPLDQDVAK